ncbi:hypothetical protein ACVBEH_18395 [Roseateles sp. GG27B]
MYKNDINSILYISTACGLFALMEMPIDWNQAIGISKVKIEQKSPRTSKPFKKIAELAHDQFDHVHEVKQRYPITILGKISGFFSIITLIIYLYVRFGGL